jgi:hypothetical protein
MVKHRVLLCASLAALTLLGSRPGLAQALAPPYPGTIYPGDGALPSYEIVTIVRSTGLEPHGRPVRKGPVYTVRALDAAGEEVRVVVDAYGGRIVKVIPLAEPRYAMPLMRPPYGPAPRPMAMIPDDGFDDFTPVGPGRRALPPGSPGIVPRDTAAQATPPLPRPRPKLASSDSAAPAVAGQHEYDE